MCLVAADVGGRRRRRRGSTFAWLYDAALQVQLGSVREAVRVLDGPWKYAANTRREEPFYRFVAVTTGAAP
jgi:hypothetical protein